MNAWLGVTQTCGSTLAARQKYNTEHACEMGLCHLQHVAYLCMMP